MVQGPHYAYFLSDGARRSYIGYTNNIRKRTRTHQRKLRASAKYTKQWPDGACRLEAYIEGFTDYRTALSFEWFAKRGTAGGRYKRKRARRRKLRIGKPLKLRPTDPQPTHPRLLKFLHTLLLPKFERPSSQLTVHLRQHELVVPVQHALATQGRKNIQIRPLDLETLSQAHAQHAEPNTRVPI